MKRERTSYGTDIDQKLSASSNSKKKRKKRFKRRGKARALVRDAEASVASCSDSGITKQLRDSNKKSAEAILLLPECFATKMERKRKISDVRTDCLISGLKKSKHKRSSSKNEALPDVTSKHCDTERFAVNTNVKKNRKQKPKTYIKSPCLDASLLPSTSSASSSTNIKHVANAEQAAHLDKPKFKDDFCCSAGQSKSSGTPREFKNHVVTSSQTLRKSSHHKDFTEDQTCVRSKRRRKRKKPVKRILETANTNERKNIVSEPYQDLKSNSSLKQSKSERSKFIAIKKSNAASGTRISSNSINWNSSNHKNPKKVNFFKTSAITSSEEHEQLADICRLRMHRCTESGVVPSCCYTNEAGNWRCLCIDYLDSPEFHNIHRLDRERAFSADVGATINSVRMQRDFGGTSVATASSNSHNQEQIPEFPGFYYDVAKKKYFRILQGASGVNASAVTRETIALHRRESMQLDTVKSMLKTSPSVYVRPIYSTRNFTSVRSELRPSMIRLIERARSGVITPACCEREIRRSFSASLWPEPCAQHVNPVVHHEGPAEQSLQLLLLPDGKHLAHVYTLKNLPGSVIRAYQMNRLSGTHSTACESRTPSMDFLTSLWTEYKPDVTYRSMWWAPLGLEFPRGGPEKFSESSLQLLFISISNDIQPEWGRLSFDSFCMCTIPGTEEYRCWSCTRSICNWARRTGRCCAFSNFLGNDVLYALGTDDGIILGSLQTCTPMMELNTEQRFGQGADILSLTFARSTQNVLFAGARNARVYLFDRLAPRYALGISHRRRYEKPSAYLETSAGVANLYLSHDERYLTAADFSGKIRKFDLRQGRSVSEYVGHVNDYATTSFGVDEREELLYAVGTDSLTRVWDYHSGDLLRTIPPPLVSANPRHFPVVCLSQNLGGYGRPGLIMAIGDSLYHYTV